MTRFYVNTDNIDRRLKQIGVHTFNTIDREFCAGIRHRGTKKSVHQATRIAKLFAAAPRMLELLEEASMMLALAQTKTGFSCNVLNSRIDDIIKEVSQ